MREDSLAMAPDPADLAVIRLCERMECTFSVNNAVTELKDILQAMSNHILSMHPVSGSNDGGGGAGGAKSNAAIPALEEECNQINGLLGVLALNAGSLRVKYQTSKLKTGFWRRSLTR